MNQLRVLYYPSWDWEWHCLFPQPYILVNKFVTESCLTKCTFPSLNHFYYALQTMLRFHVIFNISIIVKGSVTNITQSIFNLEVDSFDMVD